MINVATLEHEKGHANAIFNILKTHNTQKCIPSIILVGDYKSKNASIIYYNFCHSCNAHILFFESKDHPKRGLTLHPYMDSMTKEEIKLCIKAGYDTESNFRDDWFRFHLEKYTSSDFFVYVFPKMFKVNSRFKSFSNMYYHYLTLLDSIAQNPKN